MSRKGENIYKRKDGRWEGRYIKTRSGNGKAIYGYVYAKTYREVKQKLVLIKSSLKESSPIQAVEKSACTNEIDFCQLADEWLATMQPLIKESTYVKYYNLVHSYLHSEFNGLSLSDISVDCLNAHCNNLLLSGGTNNQGLASKTVTDILSVIRNVLKYAGSKGMLPHCSGKEITIKHITKPLCVLNRAEQDMLCRYLKEKISIRNMAILLCLFTGMRVGEVCALKWADISFSEHTIYVHQTMQRIQVTGNSKSKTTVIITTPKSLCSIRTIPIPKNIENVLQSNFSNRNGYFLTGSEDDYVEPRSMQNHFKRVLKNVSLRPINFHSLRHTFATRCIEVGFDIKSLSKILGHANVNITMNRYVHPSMDFKRENMERLSGLFSVK